MKQEAFLRSLSELKERAVLQGGMVSSGQIKESFPELDAAQEQALRAYLRESHIGVDEVLADEELPDSKALKMYREELEALIKPDTDKKRAWIMSAAAGDSYAREQLTTAYLPTVFDIARLYTGQGVELADLIGEGNLALAAGMKLIGSIETADDCDELVARTVMNALEELIATESRQSEAMEKSLALLMKALKCARELSEELRRKVSVPELCAEAELSEEELRTALRLSSGLADYIAL